MQGRDRLSLIEKLAVLRWEKAADAHQDWERFNETDACIALADSLLAAGKKAEAVAIYSHLQKTRTAPAERHVRAAAERALARAK